MAAAPASAACCRNCRSAATCRCSRTPASRAAGAGLALTRGALDAVFPGHGLSPHDIADDLPIGTRQMAEIALAFAVSGGDVGVMILDEPTSSLDAGASAQLIDYVRAFTARGKSCVFISHRLDGITAACARIVVMKDGEVIADRPALGFSRDAIVAAMGQAAPPRAADIAGPADGAACGRTFLWYTTEFDDLLHCARAYVFHDGAVAGVIARAALTQAAVLGLTFGTRP